MSNLVYLAGPITGKTLGETNDWRQYVGEFLALCGIRSLDPLRGKKYLHSIVQDGVYSDAYSGHPLSTGPAIKARDKWDVLRCDLVLANLLPSPDKVSIGTVMEIAWAGSAGKLIVVVMDERNCHWHGMLNAESSVIFSNLDSAMKMIPTILGVTDHGPVD